MKTKTSHFSKGKPSHHPGYKKDGAKQIIQHYAKMSHA